MERSIQNWLKTMKKIYTSILITAIAGMIAGILSVVSYQSHSFNLMTEGSIGTNLFTITLWLSMLVFIAGTFLYFINLGAMRSLVHGKDATALGQIRVGLAIVLLAAIIILFNIPQLRWSIWIYSILNIAAYVVIMVGFNTLRKSSAMSAGAKEGFKSIFIAMIGFIIGAVIAFLFSWIPYAGIGFSVIAGVINITAFVFMIKGWHRVSNALPPVK